jgi:hypothetical protein
VFRYDFVMISFLEMDILDFMFEQGNTLGALFLRHKNEHGENTGPSMYNKFRPSVKDARGAPSVSLV